MRQVDGRNREISAAPRSVVQWPDRRLVDLRVSVRAIPVATAVARTDSVYPRTDPRYEKALIENIYDLRIKHFERKRDRELAKHLKTAADNSNNIATKRLPVERSDALRLLSGG